MRKTFFIRLLSNFMLVSIVPIVLLGVFTMLISVRISMNNLNNQVVAGVVTTTGNVSRVLEDLTARLQLFTQDPVLLRMFSEEFLDIETHKQELYRRMYLLPAGSTSSYEIHSVSSDGSKIISTSVLPVLYNPATFSDWGLLRQLSISHEPVVYPNRYRNQGGKLIALSIGSAVRDPLTGRIVGFVIIDIPEATLFSIMDLESLGIPVSHAIITNQQYLIFDNLGFGKKTPFLSVDYRMLLSREPLQGFLQQVENNRYMMAVASLDTYDMLLVSGMPIGVVLENNAYIMIVTTILAFVALLLCFLVSSLVARSISHPVSEIVGVMKKVETGNMQARVFVGGQDEMHLLGEGLNKMIENLDRLFAENLEKQDRLRIAEIRQLQAQINPHFLYNTLDSINYLSKLGMNTQINQVVAHLGTLLKNNIHTGGDIETVDTALMVIQSYLGIQQIIYPERFSYSLEVSDEVRSCLIPKLIIQPIVENAIIHGMGTVSRHCIIHIKGGIQGGQCHLEVCDDGGGMDGSLQSGSKNSIGLQNIRHRLRLYYGDRQSLHISSAKNHGTCVEIVFPYVDTMEYFAKQRTKGNCS